MEHWTHCVPMGDCQSLDTGVVRILAQFLASSVYHSSWQNEDTGVILRKILVTVIFKVWSVNDLARRGIIFGFLLSMQIPGNHPRPSEFKLLETGPRILYSYKHSSQLWLKGEEPLVATATSVTIIWALHQAPDFWISLPGGALYSRVTHCLWPWFGEKDLDDFSSDSMWASVPSFPSHVASLPLWTTRYYKNCLGIKEKQKVLSIVILSTNICCGCLVVN